MEDNRKGTWEDVTEECAVDDTGHCGFVTVKHNEITVGWLGRRVEGSKFQGNYRMTSTDNGRHGDCGAFKVEHFIPDPEPVIAYKAVIERSGMWASVTHYHGVLVYAVGETVESTHGTGIHCFATLAEAKKAYPADRSTGQFFRDRGRIAILGVAGIGTPTELRGGYSDDQRVLRYPSVKVLSVAWEEEPPKPKEEWIDITDECEVTLAHNSGGLCAGVTHGQHRVAWLGTKVNIEDRRDPCYRVTEIPATVESGGIKVEKRND